MYYNTNKNSNDYYSSYRKELSPIEATTERKNSLALATKRVGMVVFLISLIFGLLYTIKHFSADNKELSDTNKTDIENKINSSQINSKFFENNTDSETVPKITMSEIDIDDKAKISQLDNKVLKSNTETEKLPKTIMEKVVSDNKIRTNQTNDALLKKSADIENISKNTISKVDIKNNIKTDHNSLKASVDAEKIPKVIIPKNNLPKSIQIKNSESKIISNLKHNATDSLAQSSPTKSKEHNAIQKEVVALAETTNMSADDIERIVNIILKKQKAKGKSSLEEELSKSTSKRHASKGKTLKESNHYNKVVLSSKNKITKNKLQKISNKFSHKHKKAKHTKYEKSLQYEIATRSNSMRIIVVKKGDTLGKLAYKAYGKREAYIKIFKANPQIIKNPNQIYAGQRLRIPR